MSFKPTFDHSNFEIIEEKPAYSGFFKLKQYTLKLSTFDGGAFENVVRECVIQKPAVFILPYDPVRDEVVFVEQFRIGAKEYTGHSGVKSPWVLEIPAGMIEPGQQVGDVAKRELKEETGLDAIEARSIFSILMSPGGCNEQSHFYCATVDATHAEGIHGLPEEHEDIKIHVLPRAEACAMVEAGAIPTAPAVIALQWLDKHWQSFQ